MMKFDVRHGKDVGYYENGNTSLVIGWKDGCKHGPYYTG
jgi:hypothetical protein